jgi:hypothetical protein
MLSEMLVIALQVPFMAELVAEFAFIMRCHGSTKPTRKYDGQDKEDSPPAKEGNKPEKFVQMSMYGSAPYGFNTDVKEPLE